MWGARPAATKGLEALPDALEVFLEQRMSNGGLAYGDDMASITRSLGVDPDPDRDPDRDPETDPDPDPVPSPNASLD